MPQDTENRDQTPATDEPETSENRSLEQISAPDPEVSPQETELATDPPAALEPEEAVSPPRAVQPDFLTKTKFSEFDIPPEILRGLTEAGFIYCTPIQAQTLPTTLTGKDVGGQAQTGTGKTAAFLVTIFNRLMTKSEKRAGMSRALIIAPTRELALQIHADAVLLGKYTGLTMALAFGGIDYQEQGDAIRQGPDIVICTPGRIIDYLKQGIFKTSRIEVVVIDEADRLFDLGFIKDIRYLLHKLPHYDTRQSMLFSATLPYRILELTYEFMNEPEFISATPPNEVTVERIEQALFHIGREDKLSLLLGLLKRETWSSVLIFVNTKSGVEWVAGKLKGNGLPAEGITGDLPQRRRLKLMEQFKDGSLKILVATDVASRGIHVEDISHVINYDLPQDVENYVHRIGRTARAGKSGRAISFACEDYVFHLEPLEKLLGYQIPVVWPEEDWFQRDQAGPVSTIRRDRMDRPDRGDRGRRPRDRRPEERGRPGDRRPDDRERRPDERPRFDGRGRPDARGRGPESSDRRPAPPSRWKRIPMSTRPGGIFGLAPRSWLPDQSQPVTAASTPARLQPDSTLPMEPLPRPVPAPPAPPALIEPTGQPISLEPPVPAEGEEPRKKRRRRRRRKKSANGQPANGSFTDTTPDMAQDSRDDSDLAEESRIEATAPEAPKMALVTESVPAPVAVDVPPEALVEAAVSAAAPEVPASETPAITLVAVDVPPEALVEAPVSAPATEAQAITLVVESVPAPVAADVPPEAFMEAAVSAAAPEVPASETPAITPVAEPVSALVVADIPPEVPAEAPASDSTTGTPTPETLVTAPVAESVPEPVAGEAPAKAAKPARRTTRRTSKPKAKASPKTAAESSTETPAEVPPTSPAELTVVPPAETVVEEVASPDDSADKPKPKPRTRTRTRKPKAAIPPEGEGQA